MRLKLLCCKLANACHVRDIVNDSAIWSQQHKGTDTHKHLHPNVRLDLER